MPINLALLKYGYSNFSLTFLEFCNVESLMEREKYFFELYSPEYNILKNPGSPSRGLGWKHSETTREKMSKAAKKRLQSQEALIKLSAIQPHNLKVEITDLETNTTTEFHAIRAAAKVLGIDRRYIENYLYLKQEEPIFGRYICKFIGYKGINLETKVQKTTQNIEVTDVETNEITIYPSITSAGKSLGIRQSSISLYLKEERIKPFRGKYLKV